MSKSQVYLMPMRPVGSRWLLAAPNEHFRWETRRDMGTSHISFAMWFKPTATLVTDAPIVHSITTSASYIGWAVNARPDRALRLRWGADADRRTHDSFANAYEENAWNFLLLTMQRDGNAALWVNDMTTAKIGPTSMAADAAIAWSTGANPWTIGASSTSIMQQMLVARVALIVGDLFTADDRAELYNSGRGVLYANLSSTLKAKFSTTQDYFDLRERSGNGLNAVTAGANQALLGYAGASASSAIRFARGPRR